MNRRLCIIIRRVLCFIAVAHRFLQKGKVIQFGKSRAPNSDCKQVLLRHSPTVGYVGSWKKRVAVVGNDFKRMNYQSSNLLLLYDFNRFIPALYGQTFLFW